ncbi:glutamate ABC transporter substrate-binding protein [Tsukamurella asaccharolytica]|nr:glutamate ABC transporter substrate-binding protein [Tsukamurella asaccharolytica]
MQRPRGIRRIVAAITAVVLAGGLVACGSTGARSLVDSIESGSVILGTKFDQPGLGLRKPDKSMSGFDVDVSEYVVNAIAEANGWQKPTIRWRETPSAQRETLINNGEVDMITATYSINASRSKKVDFAGPYLVVRQGLLVRNDDSSLGQLADLDKGKILCSAAGSTSAQNVKAQLPGVQLQEFDSYSTCTEALHQGRIDALTTDESILAGFNEQYSGEFRVVDMTYLTDQCIKGSQKKAGNPFSTERYGIGLAKNDAKSKAALNEAIAKMIADGSWERALRKNLGATETQRLIDRAGGFDKFKPSVGDLAFVDAPASKCGGAA